MGDRDIPTGGWSERKSIAPGKWLGTYTAEASMRLKDINNNGRPEMIFAWVDVPDGKIMFITI